MPLIPGTQVLTQVLRFALNDLEKLQSERPEIYQYLVERCRGNGDFDPNSEEELVIQELRFVNEKDGPHKKRGRICASIRSIVLGAEESGKKLGEVILPVE